MKSLVEKLETKLEDADKELERYRETGQKNEEYFWLGIALGYEVAIGWAQHLSGREFSDKMQQLSSKHAERQHAYCRAGNATREHSELGGRIALKIAQNINEENLNR